MKIQKKKPADIDLSKLRYEDALKLKNELKWLRLETKTVGDALNQWSKTLDNKHTKRAYGFGISKLIEHKIIQPEHTLQTFSLINHESRLDKIIQIKEWSISTQQQRCACYIAFTEYLQRETQGMIRKALTKKGKKGTFSHHKTQVETPAMNQKQWHSFLHELKQINNRDYLIASLTLQGSKRINETLSLQIPFINWETDEIEYKQSKTDNNATTIITNPSHIMSTLKNYINGTSHNRTNNTVFITKNGKSVEYFHIYRSFIRAGEKAGIPFKITPHVLRTSAITYMKEQGFDVLDIMKVSGHKTPKMVEMYDKSDRAQNPTKQLNLV